MGKQTRISVFFCNLEKFAVYFLEVSNTAMGFLWTSNLTVDESAVQQMQLLLVMVIFIAITIVELQKQHVEKTFLDFCVILLEKGNDVHVEANGHHLFQNRDGHHHDGKQLHRWRVYLRGNHRNVICWLATSDCNEISVNTWKNTCFFDLRYVLSEYFRCLVVQGDGSRGCYRIAFMHASIGVLAWPSNIVVFIDLLKNLPGLHKEKNASGTKTKMSQVSPPSSWMDSQTVCVKLFNTPTTFQYVEWKCEIGLQYQMRFLHNIIVPNVSHSAKPAVLVCRSGNRNWNAFSTLKPVLLWLRINWSGHYVNKAVM